MKLKIVMVASKVIDVDGVDFDKEDWREWITSDPYEFIDDKDIKIAVSFEEQK